ncbi:MAG: hypothetical protein K0U76_02420, partial [Actinomycetia bacterium]|nr:hypothetical protein [Actinomycetes bacterium]
RTPTARAAAEHAMTRLASVTAIGTVEGRPAAAAAATAGQSMHHSANTLDRVMVGVMVRAASVPRSSA